MDECLEEYTPLGCIIGSGYLLIEAVSSQYLPVLWVSLLWDYLSFLYSFSLEHIYPCLLIYTHVPEYIALFGLFFRLFTPVEICNFGWIIFYVVTF